MEYVRLGNSGLIVSRLAYGVMTFGSNPDTKNPFASISKTPQQEAEALIGRAIDAGINFFDTADGYTDGQAEVMLGQVLGTRRKNVVISTKVGFRTGRALIHTGGSYQHLIAGAEACLKRLDTDYIDLLSIHRFDPYTPMEEMARALDNLIQRGLVRYGGYSNFSAWQSASLLGIQKQMGYSPLIAAQMYYSLVGRDLEHEIVPFCKHAGIGICAWSPLAGGFLSGRYTRQDPTGGKGRLATFDFLPFDKEKGYDLIERMRAIAEGHKATVAQVALAWMLAKEFISVIIVGASRMSQFEDNLSAMNVNLSAAELQELDQLTQPVPIYPNWFHQKTQDTAVTQALKSSR